MKLRHRFVVAGVIVVAALPGCATSSDVAQRQALAATRIAEIVDEARFDEVPTRCLADNQFRNFRALTDRHLLFEGRGSKAWVNTLHARCPDLRHGTILRVRSTVSLNRMCQLDRFEVDDWFDWPWYRRWPFGASLSSGMTCTLGNFQPLTEAQLAAINEVLDAR